MQKRPIDVAVLSDLHLGTYSCHAKEIVAYLKSISPQILILNGDIIDVWQFSKRYFPASHMEVVREIFQLLANGTRVFYVTGNHDEMLRRYSDLQLGNLQLVDKMSMEIDNKMTWIFHGDVFDNTTQGSARFWAKLGSNGYAVLLAFNRTLNRFLKLIGRKPVSLSRKIMKQVSKSIIKIDAFEKLIAEIAIEKKYDYVICGHIHQPQKRTIQTNKGKVVYLNSGDWVDHLTSLEYYKNDWHLYKYEEREMKEFYGKMPSVSTHVLSDEITYYLHSLGA